MIDKLISRFTKNFEITNHMVDDESGWYLQTTCSYEGSVIYTHKLDLLPLYTSMQKRMNEE